MHENNGTALLMATMMAMCVVVFVLVLAIPAVGLAPGLVVAAVAGGLMVYGHWKLMGPGRHQ